MKRKFVLLDGLRGVAALAVVAFHAAVISDRQLVPHGYLAVDFFFLLSGFVLASAYQERLDDGWSTLGFLKVRFVRLYPLYIAGLALGLSCLVIRKEFGNNQMPNAFLLLATVFGLLLLPTPASSLAPLNPNAFPLNVPAWSLSMEALANVAHALFLRRRSDLFIAAAAAASAVLLAVAAVRYHGLNIGAHHSDFLWTVPRVLTPYLMGMLLYRFWQRRPLRFALSPWVAATTLLLLLAVPVRANGSVGYDLLVTLVVFPALILTSATAQPHGRSATLYSQAGAMSYALYILHIPVREYFAQLWPRMTHHSVAGLAPTLVLLVLSLTIALLADATYDRWTRGRLAHWLQPHAAPQTASPQVVLIPMEPQLEWPYTEPPPPSPVP